MTLEAQDIEFIEKLIDKSLAKQQIQHTTVHYDLEMRERIVRVEEELKNQRELMLKGFEQVDKRFEQNEKRFESILVTMRWGFGIMVALMGLMISFLKMGG